MRRMGTSNEAAFEGDRLVFTDRPRPGTGEVNGRSVWTRIDADSYRVSRETREAADWKPQFAVTYRRTK